MDIPESGWKYRARVQQSSEWKLDLGVSRVDTAEDCSDFFLNMDEGIKCMLQKIFNE